MAHPPVRITSSSTVSLLARPATLSAMEACRLAARSWAEISGFSWACEMTSCSAKTTHMELISKVLFPAFANAPISAMDVPNSFVMASKKIPVPAAHLSLAWVSIMAPLGSILTTLHVSPPRSMMVRASGKSLWTPLAKQAIEVR